MTFLSVDPTPGDRLFRFHGYFWFKIGWRVSNVRNVSNPHQALVLQREVNGKINGCLLDLNANEFHTPMMEGRLRPGTPIARIFPLICMRFMTIGTPLPTDLLDHSPYWTLRALDRA